MNEYQLDNLAEEIAQKIKIFAKANYFNLFSYILTEKAKNFSSFKKVSSLVLSIDDLIKKKEINKRKKLNLQKTEEKKPTISPWFYFMIHICNIQNKKKYINVVKNELNIDPIIYAYMTNFCEHKIKLLTNFSYHYNLNFKSLIKFYLELCRSQIMLNKENSHSHNNKKLQEENMDEEYYNSKSSNNIKHQKSQIISSLPSKNINLKFNDLLRNNSKKDKKQVDYSNSFTRLFIGETDEESIKENYLSNIVIKKIKELHLFNQKLDLSKLYLKRLYQKFSNVDLVLNPLLIKLKSDSKKIENYQRSNLSFYKRNQHEKYLEKYSNNLYKKINTYSKPILRNQKISKLSLDTHLNDIQNKILMNFRNGRNNNLNINIKTNKNHSLLFNISSDYENKKHSTISSKNKSKSVNGFRISMSNSSKNNSMILPSSTKSKIKINLKYSSFPKIKLKAKRNSMNYNNILINIRTKLNKENESLKIDDKKYIHKNRYEDEISDNDEI